ncbi:lipase (class 3) [Metarhizium robertsii]|uniref:Fungal lipase-type domain-containing protein n=2 Tax=Metarhizium robertsii TaxID=568076 RepID=A0A0B2XFB0_METRA|nr:uncharacterized protein MAA_11667 [Metarhizium robertsii ARSEF 23]EXU94880.1 lipase (class 3) [Metarhizium robertsii]KHO10709.1 hypothetical protein MAA_11667 [Metarhizium robertsii ARSEF 23]
MYFSTKCLSILLGLVALSSAEIKTPSKKMLRDFDTFARYAAFGYCKELVDGLDVNGKTKVCTNNREIPNGCGELEDAVVVTEFPNDEGVSGYIAVNSKTQQIIVSFRGSGSWKDVQTNLRTCKTRSGRGLWEAVAGFAEQAKNELGKITRNTIISIVESACSLVEESKPDPNDRLLPFCQDCGVHQGFFEGFKGIKDKMLAAVEEQKKLHPIFEVKVTGYSLGAAVATLAAAYIRKSTLNVDLYTFGSPRVGDEKFATFVSSQGLGENFRITNENDPIANVPWADAGFAHVEPEYWFPEGIAAEKMEVCKGVNSLQCSGQFDLKLSDIALGRDRMKPHLWQSYAVGFLFTGGMSCPSRSGRELDLDEKAPFTQEEITEMKRLADQSN